MPETRVLTQDEKNILLESIEQCVARFLPHQMKACYIDKMTSQFCRDLDKVEIISHPDAFVRLHKEVKQRVSRAICPPGEAVGVLCAQSIGERQTQLTLNSFHQSGLAVATVVTGVPRFLELLNATKEPKMTYNRFSLIGESSRTPQQIRQKIAHELVFMTFKDIIVREHVSLNKEEEVWFDAFETVYSNRFRDYQHSITFFLDLKKMYTYRLTPVHIAKRLESEYTDICCVFSPLVIGQLDIFVDTSEISIPENSVDQLPRCFTPENCVRLYLEDVVKPRVDEIALCGIPNIQRYHITRKENSSDFQIDTEGSNLEQIVGLSHIVDISTVSSNNMWEIHALMGIEATRQFLIEEFTSIVSSDGTFINHAHILLLVDIMTHQGIINSISRYGLKREQVGVLSRSSFEESLDHFCNAGFYAEKEPIKAVSAAIMCGKRSKIGSGLCSLMMDWEKIESLM